MEKLPDIILLSRNRVWQTYPGGRMLDMGEGNSHPEDSHFPEDWIASIVKGGVPKKRSFFSTVI